MRGRHLFDFHDQSSFPAFWRAYITGLMTFFAQRYHPFKPVIPLVAQAVRDTDTDTVVDLGSGSSGSLVCDQQELEEQPSRAVHLVMTDTFPNIVEFEQIAAGSEGPSPLSDIR